MWTWSSAGENAKTCAPCVTFQLPSAFLTGLSTETPTLRAAFWTAEKSPLSPMNRSSNALSHWCRRLGVSRPGSVVTKTTRSLSWSAAGSFLTALAMSAMVVGHTSGQWVYPKYSTVGLPAVRSARSKGLPSSSVSSRSGLGIGRFGRTAFPAPGAGADTGADAAAGA